MTEKIKKSGPNRLRSWIINLGVFFIVLLVFYTIDGTSLEPILNDSNNIAGRAADWLSESRIFNEWISPFSFPLFNLATILFVIALFGKAVTDIFSIKEKSSTVVNLIQFDPKHFRKGIAKILLDFIESHKKAFETIIVST